MWLKRFAPSSLFGRFLLILVVPSILVPLMATYIFYERHWTSVSRHMTASLAGEVALLVSLAREGEREWLDRAEKHFGMKVTLVGAENEPDSGSDDDVKASVEPEEEASNATNFIEAKDLKELHKQIASRINKPVAVAFSGVEREDVIIHIYVSKKKALRIVASRKRIDNPTTYIFTLWLVTTTGILLVIAILFSKNQIRAITRLAYAMQRFGKGQEVRIFKPEGAQEVRQAGQEFLRMKERIERQVAQRTEMLAGVSHDLRTPLTRMKLQLALMPTSLEVQGLQTDVGDMEHMIHEYLQFARGEGTEAAIKTPIVPFIEEIIQTYRRTQGNRIAFSAAPGMIVGQLRQGAIKRCLANIIDNGLRYGKHIEVRVDSPDEGHVSIAIDDDGPGIPESERENVFRPFYRLEASRNSDTGGVGLGMAIARDIVTGHGGDMQLEDSPKGGLRVVIILPL